MDAGVPAEADVPPLSGQTEVEPHRIAIRIAYAFMALSIFFGGVTSIVSVIIAYVKRREAAGTIYESHCTWIIRTFWGSLVYLIVGVLTAYLLIGFLVLAFLVVWYLYRVIRGGLAAIERKPVGRYRRRG